MHVYFSGIGGAGLGPLALLARDCGYSISGSDLTGSPFINKLTESGIKPYLGSQDGSHLTDVHTKDPINWFVYTSALPEGHPELQTAKTLGLRISKRDEFINHIITDKNLQLVAVSGTHGKTTTTAMMIWAFHKLDLPLSYQVGTNLPWGPSAKFAENSQYFVYEADEYDRNMLQFHPSLSVIPSLDYDHPDIYPTQEEYFKSFARFAEQSGRVFTWQSVKDKANLSNTTGFGDNLDLSYLKLPGAQNRQNAHLVTQTMLQLLPDVKESKIQAILAEFPGTQRRFEKITNNLYTDYAHHPSELKAVISVARELSDKVVIVYQPHQDRRQRSIAADYNEVFTGVDKVYWLPTYNPKGRDTEVALTPEELILNLKNPSIAEPAYLDTSLQANIENHLSAGSLVVACSAGDLDHWLRSNFT